MENNRIVIIPKVLAAKSEKLAIRFTRGCVASSIIPTVPIANKSRSEHIKEGNFFSEKMKSNVISPYAMT
jgi:hypothetical protein